MIGTDFHPGIKGIGPKTGLKLIKEHGTMEAVSEVKEFEMPENIETIRGLFLNPSRASRSNTKSYASGRAGFARLPSRRVWILGWKATAGLRQASFR